MPSDRIRLTVVVPAYNAARTVSRAVGSAQELWSDALDVDVIVVDDGSLDDTAALAAAAGARVISHPSNEGIAAALNTGFAFATGDYVAWLSADDYYLGNPVAREVVLKGLDAGASLLFGGYLLCDDPSGAVIGHHSQWGLERGAEGPVTDWRADILNGCTINGSTVIARRGLFEDLGGFSTDEPYAQDYDMWCRCARADVDIYYVPPAFVVRAVHSGQLSRDANVKQELRRADARILSSWLGQSEHALREIIASLHRRDDPGRAAALLVIRFAKLRMKRVVWELARDFATNRTFWGVLRRRLSDSWLRGLRRPRHRRRPRQQ